MRLKFPKYNDSMCDTPEQLSEMMSHIKYTGFTSLKSPLETFLTTCGSCHDQVMLEIQELYDMGLLPVGKFIMAVDAQGQGLETHSFVYYVIDNEYYWFENAWEDLAGIHVFSDYDDMLDSVMFAFSRRLDYDKLYLADFIPEQHTIGEDLDTLVDICMNSAREYKIT